ncbi:MAG: MFS transporter [Kofleriaceae bacterium]|nr:MFS transporter [Kofleriaceae bacterium]
MSLAERRWLRLFTLCVLYVAQGIPWGFTATTLPAYLAAKGLSGEALGSVLVMTTLPYSFKWILGPIVDAFTGSRFGRRRPWIIFAQGAMAATILAMVAIGDLAADHKLLAWTICVHTVFNALQDVAVDALAIDLLDEDERGRANGLMYAAKYGGGAIGGAGLSWVLATSNLTTTLIVQAAMLVAIMFVPLLVRERAESNVPEAVVRAGAAERLAAAMTRLRGVVRSLAIVFSLRSTIMTAVLLLGLNVGAGIIFNVSLTLYTQHLGWKPEEYATLSGGYALLAGCAGATCAGFLADRFGRRRVIGLASIALLVSWVVFALATSLWTSSAYAYGNALFAAASIAIMSVGTFALCMDVSWSETGASQFTAYMAIANFSTTLGYRLGGKLQADLDYATCILVAAAIQLAVTLLLFAIDPQQTKRDLPLPVGTPTPRRGILALAGLALVLTGLTYYVVRDLV